MQNKLDQQKEQSRLIDEMQSIRHEVAHRVGGAELLETKEFLAGQLDSKVELDEVQNALNECQSDIVRQLDDFKQIVQQEIRTATQDLYKLVDL